MAINAKGYEVLWHSLSSLCSAYKMSKLNWLVRSSAVNTPAFVPSVNLVPALGAYVGILSTFGHGLLPPHSTTAEAVVSAVVKDSCYLCNPYHAHAD